MPTRRSRNDNVFVCEFGFVCVSDETSADVNVCEGGFTGVFCDEGFTGVFEVPVGT